MSRPPMGTEGGAQGGSGGGGGALRGSALAAGILLTLAGAAILAAGPLLYRIHALDLDAATTGMQKFALIAFGVGGAAALVALIASFVARKHRGAILAIVI